MSKDDKNGVVLREHKFDGIQEYDQRLPNWWLFTLFFCIIFSILFWFATRQLEQPSDGEKVELAIKQIEADRLAKAADTLNNETMFQMSQNELFVNAGAVAYKANCEACHGANLQGGIGFNLVDAEWVHGGSPMEIYNTLDKGIIEKGMPAWGSVLGPKGVSEVVAFILSKQK